MKNRKTARGLAAAAAALTVCSNAALPAFAFTGRILSTDASSRSSLAGLNLKLAEGPILLAETADEPDGTYKVLAFDTAGGSEISPV
ncbi:MAG: hypothetical protein HUJ54_14360, partial [Erysipelotrichaceae bacterium]|nr:hypothetical protein [Erysipelotrichaceae bacterium]